MSVDNLLPPLSPFFTSQSKPPGQSAMGREKGGDRRPWQGQARRWRPFAGMALNGRESSCHGTAHARWPSPKCNCNVIFTCARKGWGFRLVTLANPLSPKLKAVLAELLKSQCVQVSPSSASPPRRRTWLRRIVFEVNSIYSTLRSHLFSLPIVGRHRSPTAATLILANHQPLRTSPVDHTSHRPTSSSCACTGRSLSRWCSRLCTGIATYSISRLSEILSPILMVRLTRVHDVDATHMRDDVVVCPQGTTCLGPGALPTSLLPLFAELSRISLRRSMTWPSAATLLPPIAGCPGGRVETADMWGPCGPHADSAAMSPKSGSNTGLGPKCTTAES
uniref:Uncharacterized protein n=1 Tax=Oryza punctata TaxID=4537 RepID=A0A0E0JZ58_ORYPU